jgi:hypothetical protein
MVVLGWRAARPALVVTIASAAFACSYFPSHEEVFTPVPLALGDVRVTEGDTTYVLGGVGYEIVAPRRDLLPDAKLELDRASREFIRIFEVDPPPIVVRLLDSLPPRLRADSAPPPLGPRVLPVLVPRVRKGFENDPRFRRPPAVARAAARGWFAAYVDTRFAKDTTGRPAPLPYLAGEDPRLPDWLEDAVPAMIAGSSMVEFRVAQLADRPKELLPLRELFAAQRPGAARTADSAAASPSVTGAPTSAPGAPPRDDATVERAQAGWDDPRTRGRRMSPEVERVMRFTAQSLSVAQFLAEREGPAFMGRITDRLLDGGTMTTALGDAHSVPNDLDALDAAWRTWLQTQAEARKARRGSNNNE